MLEWFSTAVASANAVKDISQSLVTLRDEEKIRARVFDMTNALMELQQQLMNAQVSQMELVDEVRQLKANLTAMSQSADERKSYQLHKFETGDFAYALKAEFQVDGPEHYLCSKCFEEGHRVTLHERTWALTCARCNTTIRRSTPPPRIKVRRVRGSTFG